MPYLSKTLLGILLLLTTLLMSPSYRTNSTHSVRPADQPRPATASNLPAGVERSDWQGILAAHEEWKHTIREAPDGAQGWQAENAGSGLRVAFDGRGGVVRPAGGDWHWGLELEGYGIGGERRSVAARTPRVGTSGRRIGYDWDGNLEEWYQNRAEGLEHGYTIRERLGRPGEEAPLEVWLKVRGELAEVEVDGDGHGASFGRERGQALLRYGGLKVWDAAGREVAAQLQTAGPGELRLVVEEQTASYPLTIDPTITAQQAYIKASNRAGAFGLSVAISGETVVVGAPSEDSLANSSGAAYVFVRNGTSWTQQAYLKASDTNTGLEFGHAVAISGETVVVGTGGGSAYVFVRNGTNWTQQARLTQPGGLFSRSVAISGETLVVGDHLESNGAGAAYVFVRIGTSWSQQAYLKASNDEDRWFGQSVAISGETVVVGAHGKYDIFDDMISGAAYIFVRSETSWSQQAHLKTSDQYVFFGRAVAISGETLVVGAPGFQGSGAVYVFVRNGMSWTQQAYLTNTTTYSTTFGRAVAISGETVVVGDPSDPSNATGVNGDQTNQSASGSGAAHVFVRSGTSWTQQSYLKASNTGQGDSFGWSVAISGETVIVGAPWEDSNATGVDGDQNNNSASGSGAAYVYKVHQSIELQLAINAGNAQSATAGTTVPIAPSVHVRDAQNNPVAGIPITFTITSGGGSLTGGSTTTNASGIATVGSWTLGSQMGVNTLTASSPGLTGTPVTFTVTGIAGAVAQMEIVAGNAQATSAGAPVPIAPSVLVRDAFNNPVPGIPVTFSITSGWGSLIGAAQVTNGIGIATVGSWILGTVAGVNILTATIVGLGGSTVTFTATGTPLQMAINAGNNQTATVGTAVPIPPSILVRDVNNNPVPGVPVTFAVSSGGGSVMGGSAITNANGIATVGSWALGTAAGVNTLTATVTGLSGSPVTFTATGTVGAVAQMAIVAGNEQTTVAGAPVPVAPSVLVRDVHQNPVPGVPVTFAIASGGGSLTGASVMTNASGIATVGSWTLGTTAGPNVLTATTAGVAFTAVGTPGTVPGVPAIGTQEGAEIGPGSTVTITQTLANPTAMPTDSTYQATLPNGLFALSCTAPFGTCAIGAGSLIGSGEGELQRVAATTASAANRTVAWAGTIPGGGSVAITYQVQVGVQAINGVQQCVTSTISGLPGPQTCLAVSIPPSGPGNLPIAAGLPNQQKPGSVLIFNVYTSSVSRSQSDSQISLTNTNPANPAYVHLFFIDGSNCAVADRVVTLTQNQTVSFLASDFDPGVTGYLIAVAVDRNGCPVIGNYLVGGSVVRFESGHHASLSAIGISGLVQSPPLCNPNATTTTLAFNGVAYDELPRTLTAYTLPSLANGNSSLLIVNRIGGDLTSGAATIGGLAGLLFDDSEAARSFSINGGTCQVRGLLGNNFPRTVPRYTTVIPAGRTGWMKFWSVEDEAISGVLINEALSGLSGGYNLPVLTTTSSATLTIPVVPAG